MWRCSPGKNTRCELHECSCCLPSLHVPLAWLFLRSPAAPSLYWQFQEYSVQLTFREQWLDERLKFNDFGERIKYLTLTQANRVWMPDLFFSNEKEGHFHDIIMPNVYIRIFPNGSVLYSIRYFDKRHSPLHSATNSIFAEYRLRSHVL